MNENLDLTKILDGCPEGTEFYSSVFGNVRFVKITLFNTILMMTTTTYKSFAKDGSRLYYGVGGCNLFPSREQRDWSKFERFWDEPKKSDKFDPKTFQPFDKVLVRNDTAMAWRPNFFCSFNTNEPSPVKCFNLYWHICIPYNEETKHLVDTFDDCPEYYKWWEE